jgi:hypothetical protein
MNIRRILISEQDKKSILSMYGVKKDIISEQTLNVDGTYTIQQFQEFNRFGITVEPKMYIKKDTVIKKNSDGKSLNFDVYFKNKNNTLELSALRGNFICGENLLRFQGSNETFKQSPTSGEPFKTVMNKLFCDGSKLKSDKKEQTKEVQKPLTQKKCYNTNFTPTGNQICKLPNDKVWVYAKDGDGKWYTSRQTDTKKWCELVLPQYQVAVDKLIAGCPTTEPIVLNVKPIEQIQTKTPELQVTPKQQVQQNLNTATQGLNYLQSQKNKPV